MASIFLSLVRVVATMQVFLALSGMVWFADFYFDGENLPYTIIFVFPVIGLLAGILISPSTKKLDSTRFFAYGAILVGAILCIAVAMYRDLSLPNGPDYPAFYLRFVPLSLLLAFGLHGWLLRRENAAGCDY